MFSGSGRAAKAPVKKLPFEGPSRERSTSSQNTCHRADERVRSLEYANIATALCVCVTRREQRLIERVFFILFYYYYTCHERKTNDEK